MESIAWCDGILKRRLYDKLMDELIFDWNNWHKISIG